jgi:hypothetical protein
MEKIELYNQISREIVKNYNTYLHLEDVKILKTLEVPAHITLSHVLDTTLALKLHEVSLELKEIDSTLILNNPENYHITLFWKGLDSKLDEKSTEIGKILESTFFEFDVQELLFGPLGVSAKFYPKTEDFVNARIKLYELTNTPVLIDERFVTTWVSLAAYSQVPNEKVKQYVQDNAKSEFGSYSVNNFTLYKSTNKGLVNPETISEFRCKQH